jgi:hypothetical protein
MEPFAELEPEVATKDYPPMIDPTSGRLLSNKYNPGSSSNPKKSLLQLEVVVEDYSLIIDPASVPLSTKKHRGSSRSPSDITLPTPQIAVEGYLPWVDPASVPLPTNKHHRSSSSSKAETTLPTILIASPHNRTKTPSKSAEQIKRVYEEVLDTSRLHPNAAWSQLAHWTHKQNLRISSENDMLRMENEALKKMLGRFGRALREMGMDKQMEFMQKLNELPAIPPKSHGGGPRGSRK